MPFSLSETVTEQDYDQLFAITQNASLGHSQLPSLFDLGLDDPAVRAANVARWATYRGFPTIKAAKVVDAETGQIVAFATVKDLAGPPFASATKSDVRIPHVSEEARPLLEWVNNCHNDRRREMAELQVPGRYLCMFYRQEIALFFFFFSLLFSSLAHHRRCRLLQGALSSYLCSVRNRSVYLGDGSGVAAAGSGKLADEVVC